MERWGLQDRLVLQAHQVDQGRPAQDQWDRLDHLVFLVILDFQGPLGFLEVWLVPRENQETQDHLGFLEHQGCLERQDQMLSTVELDTQDHRGKKAKWVLQEEEASKEKKEMREPVSVSLVPWALQALQDLPGGRGRRETQDPLDGLEKKVYQELLVLKDLQDHPEILVPQDHLAKKEKRGTWSYHDSKGAKEKEDLMGSQGFQGNQDSMAGMEMMARREIRGSQGIMKMQYQETEGFLGLQGPQEEQALGALQVMDIQAHQAREDYQELQATQERGDRKARRAQKVSQFLVM